MVQIRGPVCMRAHVRSIVARPPSGSRGRPEASDWADPRGGRRWPAPLCGPPARLPRRQPVWRGLLDDPGRASRRARRRPKANRPGQRATAPPERPQLRAPTTPRSPPQCTCTAEREPRGSSCVEAPSSSRPIAACRDGDAGQPGRVCRARVPARLDLQGRKNRQQIPQAVSMRSRPAHRPVHVPATRSETAATGLRVARLLVLALHDPASPALAGSLTAAPTPMQRTNPVRTRRKGARCLAASLPASRLRSSPICSCFPPGASCVRLSQVGNHDELGPRVPKRPAHF